MGQGQDKMFSTVSYGYHEIKGRRPTMEDAHVLIKDAFGVREHYFFAVFDGHGGDSVSTFCGDNVVAKLNKMRPMRSARSSPSAIANCLKRVHVDIDKALRNEKPKGYCIADFCGATAVMCLVTPTHYIVSNLGDSRAVLCRAGGKAVAMTADHKPYEEGEKARIEKAGGKVFWGRVNGKLAVSRALGDFTHKGTEDIQPENQMVTCVADVEIFERQDDDLFLILACDGVWDTLSNEEACKVVVDAMAAGEKQCGRLAVAVVDGSYSKGSTDNITAVVACLIKPPPAKT